MKISQCSIPQSSHLDTAGFTLTELLVAISATAVIFVGTGYGLMSMAKNSEKANAATTQRLHLNRALDFVTSEVRSAANIATDASANLGTVAPNFNATGKTPVLVLQVPNVPQRVIYYIASSSGTNWLGPSVVSRWGPNFNLSGQYTNSTNPSSWSYEPLVDLIANTTPTNNTACPSGWSANPAVTNRTGFYSCIEPNGRIAEVYLRGLLTSNLGTANNYTVTSRAYARNVIASPSPAPAPVPTPSLSPVSSPLPIPSISPSPSPVPSSSPSPSPSPSSSPTPVCRVPLVNGIDTKNGVTAVTSAISAANLVGQGTQINSGQQEASGQSPVSGTQVPCGSTVTYNYKT